MTTRFSLIWVCAWGWALLWCGTPVTSHAACQDGTNVPAASPVSSEEAQNQVTLQSDTLEYRAAENFLHAEGRVMVQHRDMQVFADQLDLNTVSGEGVAWGNVRLHTPEDDVRAVRVVFQLPEGRGILYDGQGVVSKTYQVAGTQIARLGPQTYTVERGRVTTCTGAVPDWEFRAQQARIGLGNYAALTHPSFWIKGIPVFYLPYVIVPLRDRRTTGFLQPSVGVSEADGYRLFGEFFWAMTDWADATVGLDYFSKRGVMPRGEFRYAIDPLSGGLLEGAYLRDQELDATLWRVLVQQQQEFGWGVRGLTQIDLRSDLDILRRFSKDIRQESDVRSISFGTLTKLWPNGSLTLAGESYNGLPEVGITEQFRRFPTLRFTQFPTAVLGVAWFEVETSYSRLQDTLIVDDTPVQRLELFPRLTLPLMTSPWLRLAVTGGVHATWYERQTDEATSVFRPVPDLRAQVQGPTLWRRYGNAGQDASVIHLLDARLDYRYVPAVTQADIPPFEALDEAVHFLDPLENLTLIDRIRAANYAKVSLVNRLYRQGIVQGVPQSAQEIAQVTLSQGFDLREATEGSGQVLGPLDLETTFFLWQRLQLTTVLRWQAARGELQEANWRATWTIAPGWVVFAANNNRFEAPDTRYLSGGVVLAPAAGWQVGYNFRYDGLSGDVREHLLSLVYRAQCWNVTLRYRLRELGDTDFFVHVDVFRF